MCRKARFLYVMLVFFLSFCILSPVTFSLTLGDILEGIKHNESLIKSGKGNLVVKSKTTEHGKQHFVGALLSINKDERTKELLVLSSEISVSYSFEGKKFRCDTEATEKTWDGEVEKEERRKIYQAYDGETLSELRISPNDVSAVLDSRTERVNSELDPRYWGVNLWGRSTPELVESLSPELIDTETLDGDICYVVKLNLPVPPGVPPEKVESYKLWIAPQKGYRLRKIETSTTREILVTVNQFREISPGIWFPYSGKKQWFLIDPDTGNHLLGSETTMELKDFQVNIDIPDDTFKIAFEKGVEVYDVRTGKSYMVK